MANIAQKIRGKLFSKVTDVFRPDCTKEQNEAGNCNNSVTIFAGTYSIMIPVNSRSDARTMGLMRLMGGL